MDSKLLICHFFILFGLVISASVDFNRNSVDFSADLYNQIVKAKPNENIIISPLSIQTAVGLAYMGAGSETAEEIATGLRLGTSEKSTVGTNFKELLDLYKDGNFVKIANKIYAGKDLKIKPEFNEIAQNQFYSEAENIDFAKNNVAAETINKWVEDKTNNKIRELVSSDDLNEDTRAIFVNAIYFKSDWENQFNRKLTTKQDFHVSKTAKVKIPTMSTNSNFKYGAFDDLKATGLEMNYKDSDLSMLFILPNEIEGLAEVEEKLVKNNLLDISNRMGYRPVEVALPIFRIEYSVELKDILSSMGMKEMFTDNADFSNLSSEELKVFKVIHKAFIEVNEKGTEAGAATAIQLADRILPKYFIADHPFFFALKSKSNIIFSGKFVKN